MDQRLDLLHQKLQSKECQKFLMKKLEQNLIWRKVLPKRKEATEEVKEKRYWGNVKNFEETFPYNTSFFSPSAFKKAARDGMIAGGALAAWLNEFINSVPAVINDIDYFYYDFGIKDNKEIEIKLYEALNTGRHGYEIQKISNEDKLNKIRITIGHDFSWQQMLQSFDLNSTMVAYNPFTRELIYHKEFLEFLCLREIKPYSQWMSEDELTSYARGEQKARELKAKFKMHIYMQQFIFKRRTYWWKRKIFDFKVTNKRALHGLNYHAEIEEYQDPNDPTKKIFNVVYPHKNFYYRNSEDYNPNWIELITEKRLKYWKARPELFSPWLELGEGDRVKLTEYSLKLPWLHFLSTNEYSVQFEQTVNTKIFSTWRPPDFDQKKEIEEKPYYLKSRFFYQQVDSLLKSGLFSLFEFQRLGEDNDCNFNLEKEFSLMKLKKVAEFCQTHDEFKKFMIFAMRKKFLNFEFNDILNFMSIVAGFDLKLIGVLEASFIDNRLIEKNNYHNNLEEMMQSVSFKPRLKEILKRLLKRDYYGLKVFLESEYLRELDHNFLVEPIKLPRSFSKYFYEITTTTGLAKEGLDMDHCVWGYSDKVRNEKSRIFHIMIGGKKSTLQLVRIDAKPELMEGNKGYPVDHYYGVREHKAYHNAPPHQLCVAVAERIIKILHNYYDYQAMVAQLRREKAKKLGKKHAWERKQERLNKERKLKNPNLQRVIDFDEDDEF